MRRAIKITLTRLYIIHWERNASLKWVVFCIRLRLLADAIEQANTVASSDNCLTAASDALLYLILIYRCWQSNTREWMFFYCIMNDNMLSNSYYTFTDPPLDPAVRQSTASLFVKSNYKLIFRMCRTVATDALALRALLLITSEVDWDNCIEKHNKCSVTRVRSPGFVVHREWCTTHIIYR